MIEFVFQFAIAVVLIITLFYTIGLIVMGAIAIGIITTRMNEP